MTQDTVEGFLALLKDAGLLPSSAEAAEILKHRLETLRRHISEVGPCRLQDSLLRLVSLVENSASLAESLRITSLQISESPTLSNDDIFRRAARGYLNLSDDVSQLAQLARNLASAVFKQPPGSTQTLREFLDERSATLRPAQRESVQTIILSLFTTHDHYIKSTRLIIEFIKVALLARGILVSVILVYPEGGQDERFDEKVKAVLDAIREEGLGEMIPFFAVLKAILEGLFGRKPTLDFSGATKVDQYVERCDAMLTAWIEGAEELKGALTDSHQNLAQLMGI